MLAEVTPDAQITKELVNWPLSYKGRHYDLTTDTYNNLDLLPGTTEDPILIVPGYGEREFSATETLRYCAGFGIPAVAALIDTHQVEATYDDVLALGTESLPAITRELQVLGRVGETPDVIGHSMGGGIVGLALKEASEEFGDVGLAQAVGLDVMLRKLRIPDDDAHRRAFYWRFGRVLAGPYLEAITFSSHGRTAMKDLMSRLTDDVILPPHKGFKVKATLSTTHSTAEAVINHALNGNRVAVFTGTKDPLVRTNEVRAAFSLAMANVELSEEQQDRVAENISYPTLPVRHAYLGWKAGNTMIKTILNDLAEA